MADPSRLTLRQIEIVRAIMVTGSISGAARLLEVAQPGVSRTLKHMETALGLTLFQRQSGRLIPAPEARDIFLQVQEVHARLENLQLSVDRFRRGHDVELSIGSVSSIAQVMVPRAIAQLRRQLPELRINLELLKLEEIIDFLMLRTGEMVCTSSRFDHPSIEFLPLSRCRMCCIVERSHPLARKPVVSIEDMAGYPIVGIDPRDPYGRNVTGVFARRSLTYETGIRARFISTVISLVKQDLGIAILDAFSVSDIRTDHPDILVLPIDEDVLFETFVAVRRDIEPSGFAQQFIGILRQLMVAEASRAALSEQ